ncbi:primase-helicase family protein [Tardiphaga sp. 841_E9_N1_2]|uniref:primase-helicase family protein n=1 Tax=Tardiphaga sp. 841_E9_N1_2 TaxID=3240762 RepID=UPI003F280067
MDTQVTKRSDLAYQAVADHVEGDDIPPAIKEINEHNALTMWGGKAVVVHEDETGALQIRTVDAHKNWLANRRVQITDAEGNSKTLPLGVAWLTHPQRRQYEGVEFFPNPDGKSGRPNFLNLWRGFSVEPSQNGSYGVFRDHIFNNVCDSDPALYAYVFGWFAHMMQRPRDKLGTALVLCGKMGAGKSKLGEVFGSLIAPHYVQVDEARYVTGNFNSHMADCLLLQADEAVWAGDKAAEGRLKGLITSEKQLIEAKGVEPIRVPNYVHCIMTSNESWVVPAGLDERRFCVLDVHPRCAQNHLYFQEMHNELKAGGRERLLYDLLNFDLDSVDLRVIPKTQALLDQKLRSLESVDSYWYGRLWEGTTLSDGSEWLESINTETLFQDYIKVSTQIGERRRQKKSQFGERLKKLGATKNRPSEKSEEGESSRPYHYCFPSLEEARSKFQGLVGQIIDWPAMPAVGGADEEVP